LPREERGIAHHGVAEQSFVGTKPGAESLDLSGDDR